MRSKFKSQTWVEPTPKDKDVERALRYLTIAQLARLCNVHYLTAYKWARGMHVPNSKLIKRVIRLFLEGRNMEEKMKVYDRVSDKSKVKQETL